MQDFGGKIGFLDAATLVWLAGVTCCWAFLGLGFGKGDTMPVWGARNLLNGFSKRIGLVIAMPKKELILRDIIES